MRTLTGNYQKDWKQDIVFYVFLLVYASFMLYLCNELNIWVDEAYTLDTTSKDLPGVIKQSYSFEVQPPAYFILLSLWRHISSSVFFARLFSLIFIGFTAVVLNKIARIIAGANNSSRWMVVLFLLNPFTVWAGLEIRLYSFLLFLSVSAIYLFFQFYKTNKNNYLPGLVFTCIIGVYTQYFFVFLITGFAAILFLYRGWKGCFKFCLYMIPVVVLLLVSVLQFPPDSKYIQTQKLVYTGTQQLILILKTTQDLFFSFQLGPLDKKFKVAIKIVFITLFAFSYYKMYKQNKEKKSWYFEAINIIILLLTVFIILTGVFFAYTRIDYQFRYLTIIIPVAVLAFLLFKEYPLAYRRLIWVSIAAYYIFLLVINYKSLVKQYDYKSIARYVEKIEQKDEPVLFYHNTISLSFMHYYKGSNPIVLMPHTVRFDSTTYMGDIKDTFELKSLFEGINTASKSYLLVSDLTEPHNANNPNLKMVNNYLPVHYNITIDTLYFGRSKEYSFRIRRLVKK